MKYGYIALAIFGCMFWLGCNVINPKESVPTYVHVDSFTFKNSPYYGSNSHNISCAWVYYNNNPVGVFDLPFTAPVITSGKSGNLIIVPGVEVDGLLSNQVTYPFYMFDSTTLPTTPGKVFNFQPSTQYFTNTKILINNDFESGQSMDTVLGPAYMTLTRDASMIFEGTGSGYINLQGTDTLSIVEDKHSFAVPTSDAYIEINYKATVPFYVGVDIFDQGGSELSPDFIIGVKPASIWKKMYISLSGAVQSAATLAPGGSFKLLLKASLPAGQANGYLLVDNIKVVTH